MRHVGGLYEGHFSHRCCWSALCRVPVDNERYAGTANSSQHSRNVVTSVDGRHHANIQVKTSKNAQCKFWIICSAKKFAQLPFGEHDFYLLLRPCRADDPREGKGGVHEFEGFMLTAQEARKEMKAHLNFKTGQGTAHKFPLCIWLDKGKREQSWPENKVGDWQKNKTKWRKKWNEFEL